MKKYQKCYAIDQGRCQEIFSGGVELWVTGEQKKNELGVRKFCIIYVLFCYIYSFFGCFWKNSDY